MGSTRSHPLPVEMPATSSEFDDWTEKDFDEEIDRLNKRLKELDEIKKAQETVEDGEHICHMFDGECLACEMDEDGENTDLEDFDEEEDEVRVLTEEEVQNGRWSWRC